MEAIWVAVEVRAGGVYALSAIAIATFGNDPEKPKAPRWLATACPKGCEAYRSTPVFT